MHSIPDESRSIHSASCTEKKWVLYREIGETADELTARRIEGKQSTGKWTRAGRKRTEMEEREQTEI